MPSNHLRSLSILQSLMLNSDFRAKDIWLEGRVAYGPEECVCVGGGAAEKYEIRQREDLSFLRGETKKVCFKSSKQQPNS